MQLNGSALNGAALNASARSTFILAFCAAVASADVSAAGAITRYCGSTVAASCELSSSPNQHYAAVAAFSGSASIVAAPPYQTFASASIAVSTGESSAAGDVTRYCLADIAGNAEITPDAGQNHVSGGAIAGSAEVVAPLTSVLRPADASPAGSVEVSATSFGIRHSPAAVSGTASVTAEGGHVVRGQAAAGGTAAITVNAGYGAPSATVVVSSAQVYAYAKATRMCFANPGGSATVTATGRLDAYGVANIECSAQAGAWVVQMQGAADAVSAAADIAADATYVHMSFSDAGGDAVVEADADVTRYAEATIDGDVALRVETQVNNELEGFALPDALSTVTLNALGVVVAPLVSHFDGSSEVVANGTYQHMAQASGGCSADVAADAIYAHMADAGISGVSTVAAEAHWEWHGSADVDVVAFSVEAYPALRQLALAAAEGSASLMLSPARITRATVVGSAGAEIEPAPLVTRYGLAGVSGAAGIVVVATTVGNPEARDPDERTMRRPFTDRTMRRPFVDRTMKATRT